ncbi:MAG TPA: DPP IV N-terminal domain-containing protein [Pyrinomonadaceae bacterium]|nr:DPP IV N-terminal domain-containing protein [Pyrinomonadaceae bacterium]
MDEKAQIYRFDNVRVEVASFRLWKDDRAVQVEPKAFQVLLFLIENRGRLVEKRELLDAVWKETFVTENALTREIAQLRKALGESAREAKYIETVPTKGYRFIADVEVKNGRQAKDEDKGETAAIANDEPVNASASSTVASSKQEDAKEARRSKQSLAFIYIATLIVIALTGLLVWYLLKRPVNETRMVRRITQITTWAGLDIYPSLSPDGSSIAYSSDHNGNFEIYVKPLASGGHEIQLTSDGAQNFEPAWSPDGQYIAYHSRDRGGIWIVPALGGVARRLTEFGSKPAWSRDGSMIAFQSEAVRDLNGSAYGALPPSTIWTVQARGGEPRQITQVGVPQGGHSSPSWSPDGKRIVFLAYDTTLAEIWSVAAEGSDLKQLTTQQLFFDPVYAPDGESVYCVGNSRNLYGLWKIPVARATGMRSGDVVEVQSAESQPIRNLSISADGKRIAYSARSLTSDIWSVPLSVSSSEATAPPAPLMQDRSVRKTNPTVSPDGKKIAFSVWRSGAPVSIWLMDADGKNPAQLTTGGRSSGLPTWLSNDELAYLVYQDDSATIISTNLKTGVERPLFSLTPDMDFPRLAPDGRQLAYNSGKSGTINIWKIALEKGQPQQLTFDKELMGWPIWSPDGRLIACEMKRGDDTHIAIIPDDGGTPTQLTFDHGQSWPHSWSPDGDKIAFAGFRNGVWNVWWVSVRDRTEKQLTNFNKLNTYVRYPAWSPLGNQMVFEYAEMTGNIWTMELK